MPDTMRFLIRASGARRLIAVMDDTKLAEYYTEETGDGSLAGALVLGRVERVAPAMGAAFVDIGQPQNGFLPLAEMESYTQNSGAKPLATGQELIFQIKKDAHEQKGAYLTRDVALPGQHIIYMPFNRHVGVSKRVSDEAERARLLAAGQELCGAEHGVVMREASLHAKPADLREELAELKARWAEIRQKAEFTRAPAVLYRESVLAALLRDYAQRYRVSITCNDAVNRMPAPPTGLMWEQVNDAELDALWQASRVDVQLQEALARRVSLRNGSTLVIDEREALTTIDVNSASYLGDAQGDMALKLNIAVCDDIARQIRLRNLSGIILIDFIDMHTEEERAQVSERLMAELSRERVKTVVHGFTRLGFLEMTRKRTAATLREQLCVPCEKCHATGYRQERDKKK
ncbi:MAG: ribonuclease E/G [Candidatus Limiplasma sp.]|nr:ribonuclease E/G [Candidatus Limiplasma sp.]